MAPRLLVVGIDGATWQVADPLMAAGRLPHLAALRARGAWGTVTAEYRASPALWTSIFTGKRKEKHGIEFFGGTARAVRARRLWEICEARGMVIGVCGVLVTWPPAAVRGFLIPDLFALGPETHPPELRILQSLALSERAGVEGSLRRRIGEAVALRRLGASWRTLARGALVAAGRGGPLDRRWQKILLQPALYADVFLRLCRTYAPDFAAFHYHATDTISHMYWKYHDPDRFPDVPAAERRRYGRIVHLAYEEADRLLGRLLTLAGPETTIAVVSDHGFTARAAGQYKYELRFERLLDLLGLRGWAVPARMGDTYVLHIRAADVRQRAAEALRGLRLADTGEPLFEVRESEGFIAFLLDATQDLRPRRFVLLDRNGLGFDDLFTDRGFIVSGQHAPDGVVILAGPGVQPGKVLGSVALFEITPTLLVLAGLPVARDMDGGPRLDAIAPDFLRRHPVAAIDTYEEPIHEVEAEETTVSEVVLQRLRGLGYL